MTSPETTAIHPGELPGALCPQTDPEVFFPEAGGSPKAAKRVCAACEVRPECLALALSLGPVMGVWGGLTERERASLKRAARTPAPARRATKAASDARRTRNSRVERKAA